jgi:predicted chitinase
MVSKQFGCTSVADNGDVQSVVQVGSGGKSGMIIDNSKIF